MCSKVPLLERSGVSWVLCLAIYAVAISEVKSTFVPFLLREFLSLPPMDAQDTEPQRPLPLDRKQRPQESQSHPRHQLFLPLCWRRDSAKEYFLEHRDLGVVIVHPELGWTELGYQVRS